MLYTLSTPDWKEAKRQTDIYLVSLQQGVSSTRQMTFTKEKNETSPHWARDGSFFVFLSNREAPESAATRNQLYVMRPDGGEARRITDAKEGVSDFAFSRDGKWLVYRSGKAGEEQLYRLPVRRIETAQRRAAHEAPDRHRHVAVGARQHAHLLRRRRHASTPTRRPGARRSSPSTSATPRRRSSSLWALDLDAREDQAPDRRRHLLRRPTSRSRTTASGSASAGCRRTATSATSRRRTSTRDLYLLETATGHDRAADQQREVGESGLSFSPDSTLDRVLGAGRPRRRTA